jgi:hypothetical protein
VKLKAHWKGELPKVGEYFMSTQRPKYAYLVVDVGAVTAMLLAEQVRLGLTSEHYSVEIEAERVSPFDVPDDAVVHSWKWDDRSPKRRAVV